MTIGPAGPRASSDDPHPPQTPGQPGHGSTGEVPGVPTTPDQGEGEVDVLYLAGQRPAQTGEWLLITAVDGTPGGEYLARALPAGGRYAHGGDVLIRLDAQTGNLELPAVDVSAWAVIGGLLIPVAAWNQQDLDHWPERTRATAAFAMGMLTELEDHGADLGAHQPVDLDTAADDATGGVPAGITIATAQPGTQPVP
jgi:hypothetical protein